MIELIVVFKTYIGGTATAATHSIVCEQAADADRAEQSLRMQAAEPGHPNTSVEFFRVEMGA